MLSQNKIREDYFNFINKIHFIQDEDELVKKVEKILATIPIEFFNSKPPSFVYGEDCFHESTYGELTVKPVGHNEITLRYLYKQ